MPSLPAENPIRIGVTIALTGRRLGVETLKYYCADALGPELMVRQL